MILVYLLSIIYMACAYRYRGGWKLGTNIDSPRALELFSVSWPIGVLVYLLDASLWGITTGLIIIILTMLGHSLGHGNAMNLGRREYTGTERKEVWDYLVGVCKHGMSFPARRVRDSLALTLSGITPMLPGIAGMLFFSEWLLAIALFLAGIGKTAVYELGWTLHKENSKWRLATEIGEVAWGALLGAAYAFCYIRIIS